MKSKSIYTLVAIFAILIVIYIIQNNSGEKKPATEEYIDLSKGVNGDEIAEVDVFRANKPDSGIILALENDSWKVKTKYNAPAKKSEIDKLMEDLTGIKGELRGTNPELAGDFGLKDSQVVKLIVKGNKGDTLLNFALGKRGPDYRGVFLKESGSNNIYLSHQNLLQSFGIFTDNANPDSKRWVETKVFDYNRNDLQKIKIISRNKSIELINEVIKTNTTSKADSIKAAPKKKWKKGKLSPGVKLADNQANPLVGMVVNLRATDVANPDSVNNYGFERPKYKIEITDSAGDLHTFIIGKQVPGDENNYYARILGKNIIFIVNKSGFNNIFVTPFKKKK